MASGDLLVSLYPTDAEQGNLTQAATLDTFDAVDGVRQCLDFDGATDEQAVFSFIMPRNYGGGGLTITFWGAVNGTSAGSVILDAQIERIADTDDLDSTGGSDFAAANSVTTTANTAADDLFDATITFTDGADMDSLAAGELGRLKVNRDANNASDDNTDDYQLLAIEIKET